MDVHSLIEAIGTSVSEAQQGIERHSIKRFLDYFQKPDTVMAVSNEEVSEPRGLAPITEKMVLPCSDDIGRSAPVEVPLVDRKSVV